jgi:hypothetical protein
MKHYLRWGLRQFYLLYFRPTQFGRELEGDNLGKLRLQFGYRARYMLKILPFVIVLVFLGDLIISYICAALGITFRLESAWAGMAFGVAFGVLAGVTSGVAFGVTFSVAFGVVSSSATGLSAGTISGILFGLIVSFAASAALGILAYKSSMWHGMGIGLGLGIVGGLISGLPRGAGFGLTYGVYILMFSWAAYFRAVTYPLDAALSTLAYFTVRRQPYAAIRAWRWCPMAWNEVVWLPLPFMSKLLVLIVRQDRNEGFKRIAFVAAERRLQRRVALDALVEVAFDDLSATSTEELADVPDRLGWTINAPTDLPFDLVSALPSFDRAAQHVAQYYILNNAFRKSHALRSAAEEVESSQIKNIVAARGTFAPRILEVANQWRALIERERERVKGLTDTKREIPNPFVSGNPVMETEHNVFTGRRDVVRQIEASLLGAAQAPTLLLQGPRRMGKTSILNQLPRLLGPDFAPVVVDCQNPAVTGSEATLLRYLSRALSEGLRRRRVQVEVLSVQQLTREPYAVFDEWLEKVERAMPQGMRALLCLDEYERLQSALDAGWGAPFLDTLRHTFQHRPRVVLMFAGAHTFQELGAAWTDRFVSARRMRVSFLTRADVELLLTKPIPEFDMTYAPGALDALMSATNCHPFLTQAVAFELVQLLNESQRREATVVDVEEAIGRAFGSGDAYFVNVWDDAGAEGQAILSALAAGRTPPEFHAANTWLREHDVVGADGNFAVEMLKRWVASKAAGV